MRIKGFGVAKLTAVGASATALAEAGFSAAELKAQGFSARALKSVPEPPHTLHAALSSVS